MNRPSRLKAYVLVGAVLGGLQESAYAQTADTPAAAAENQAQASAGTVSAEKVLTPADLDLLRKNIIEELKDELRKELKEEIQEEILGEIKDARGSDLPAPSAPVEGDSVVEEGWKWAEPERPELDLIELDGYFRFRYDFFNELDLGTYYNQAINGREFEQGPFVPGVTSPPVPLCSTDVRNRVEIPAGEDGSPAVPVADSCANGAGDSNSIGGANIRFRLEPTLNVYEDIKIKSQIDILDNLVLGSTPDSLSSTLSPLAALSQTQISPTSDLNVLWRDSIRVKRVWAEVMTPLGQLSFGRMPNHVGLGVTANDGRGIDMDFGDTVDRVMFSAQIGDFLVSPAFDWAASGPTSINTLLPQGQPFDRDQRDDVNQYVLTVAKIDSPEVRANKLANDEIAFDFGTQLMLRFQALDSQVIADTDGSVADQATSRVTLERNAQIFTYTAWAEFHWRKLTISAEYSGVVGRIGNTFIGTPDDPATYGRSADSVDLNQHGGALRATYKFLENDALTLELLVVAASGDDAPGWGLFPLLGDGTNPGAWDGNQAPVGDDTISNFRFDPDFIVDLIFWRQLVGAVTDALVVRPSIQYNLKQFGGRLDAIYSRSWFATSTPSGSFSDLGNDSVGGLDENLGIEVDATIFYRPKKEGFNAQLQYGIFFPLDGLDRQVFVEDNVTGQRAINPVSGVEEDIARLDANIAHTIQVLFAVTF